MASAEGRYRRIHVRIHDDEKFTVLDPLEKLVWYTLLTHKLMTPMGAAVMPLGVIDDTIGRRDGVCWRCQASCQEHRASVILDRFRSADMILWDGSLVIVLNYLVHNAPENPNTLASWIGACVELPRSPLFGQLLPHLQAVMNGRPRFLFSGLLEPLARQENRTLLRDFWARIGRKPATPEERMAKPSTEASGEASGEGSPDSGTGTGTGTGRDKDSTKKAAANATAVSGAQQPGWVPIDEVVKRTLSEWRPTVKLLARETGVLGMTTYDLGFVAGHLNQLHTPSRVQREIEIQAALFNRRGKPLTDLTFEYLWGVLQHQRSLPLRVSKKLKSGQVTASKDKLELYEQAGKTPDGDEEAREHPE